MTITKIGDDYADADFTLLGRHLRLLDSELNTLNATIAASRDPDSAGLCDSAEYFIGSGFVAVQRYLTATRAGLGISTAEAFAVPPIVKDGLSLAAALSAGANYWKHMEEWIDTLNKSENAELKGNALRTLRQLVVVTPWEDYTSANLLATFMDGQALELSRLLPGIEEWRRNVFALHA